LKPVEVRMTSEKSDFREEGEWEKRENNWGNEPNQGTIYMWKSHNKIPCATIIY
jgi:hypothetical protein